MLPLDLHVLSLSLAFILSQDQTLHCKIPLYLVFKIILLFLYAQLYPLLYIRTALAVYHYHFNILKNYLFR